VILLTAGTVARLLTMERAFDAVRTAARQYSAGDAIVPPRAHLMPPFAAVESLVMPAAVPDPPALGVKLWYRREDPPGSGKFEQSALLHVLDLTSGDEALMDATALTDIRTGAMTGVACELLAPPAATTLGLIGTGRQARTQLDAVAAACALEEVRVWSRNAERAARFAAEMQDRHPALAVRAAASARDAVEGADVAVAATTATEPVIAHEWIRPGMLVCGVGSHAPHEVEIDPHTVAAAARVVVDTRYGSVERAGDIAQPLAAGAIGPEAIHELGEVLLGTAPGRRRDDEILVFKSTGFGALDVVTAMMVLEAARAEGAGTDVSLR
jgi:ornithine cyclodeaminase/alanine dehydrogenase-like protein (mu-crystallin family)